MDQLVRLDLWVPLDSLDRLEQPDQWDLPESRATLARLARQAWLDQ